MALYVKCMLTTTEDLTDYSYYYYIKCLIKLVQNIICHIYSVFFRCSLVMAYKWKCSLNKGVRMCGCISGLIYFLKDGFCSIDNISTVHKTKYTENPYLYGTLCRVFHSAHAASLPCVCPVYPALTCPVLSFSILSCPVFLCSFLSCSDLSCLVQCPSHPSLWHVA